MKSVKEISDLKNKKVLLRADFDIPVMASKIVEKFRIEKQKTMISYLVRKGAQIVMLAHVSATDSFKDLVPQLEEVTGYKIKFVESLDKLCQLDELDRLVLLDNTRKWLGEKENNDDFAKRLAKGFDLYINNAFAVCHRNHASVSAITKFLPSYAGFLIEEEISQLQKIFDAPKEGKIVIMAGAKADTKIPVIKNFLNKAEKILLGGVIANDILKAGGQDIGDSVVDKNIRELFTGLDLDDQRLIIPDDFNKFENKILDIGPKSTNKYKALITAAKLIIWNGPMGLFEDPQFARGTKAVAEAIVASQAHTVIGGGDTIAAVSQLGLIDKFDFVSTGGGAMLAFLAGEKLLGLEKLGYYD